MVKETTGAGKMFEDWFRIQLFWFRKTEFFKGKWRILDTGDDYLQKYRTKHNLLRNNSAEKDQEFWKDHKIGTQAL